ncbi:MAG: serine/threonine protein kinase [Betaproteobacteria bacterium]|nr:serine/threonine protein kinase [Betaproteobacteria bacterium]
MKPLFERLLDVPAGERVALAGRLSDDAALRAEVLSLLAEHEAEEAAPAFLAQPARWPADAPPDLAGQRLGAWHLVAPLGAGGMGEVWEARRDDGAYEARAAVKLLPAWRHDEAGAAARLALFEQETRALARLAHPHIARLLDAGRSPDGRPYFVMEAVDGRPLDEACRGLPLAARLALFLQLADAVDYAHRQGLLHRDLKPANVLVDVDGQVKLLDFGIAQVTGLEGEQPGPHLLTPGYASPEQVRGEAAGPAGDVYSLGVLLHVLLTGALPYGPGEGSQTGTPASPITSSAAAAAPAARKRAAQLHAVLHAPPTRPSRVRSRAGAVDARERVGDLDAIVLKALAKAVNERYASVRALADDVRAFLGQRPVAARPRTAPYVAARFVARHRSAVAVAGLALLPVALAGAVLATQAARLGDAAPVPAVSLMLLATLALLALPALGAGLVAAVRQARRAARARDEARVQLAETGRLVRNVLMRHADLATYLPGGLKMKAELLAESIVHLERLHVLAPHDGALAAELAKAHARLADLQLPGLSLSLERPDEARVHAARALVLFPLGEPASRDDAELYVWWGRALRAQAVLARHAGQPDAALAIQRRTRRLLHAALSRFASHRALRFELASVLLGIGQALCTWFVASLERAEEALAVFDEARIEFERLAADQPDDGDAPYQLGTVAGARQIALFKLGRLADAVTAGREAVRQRDRALALAPQHSAYREGAAGERSNLTLMLLHARFVDEAVQVSLEGEALIRALEADDPAVPTWTQRRRWFALQTGRALLAAGRAAEAETRLAEAMLAMPAPTAGATLARRGLCALELARARRALGRDDGARDSAALAIEALAARVAEAADDADSVAHLAAARAFITV